MPNSFLTHIMRPRLVFGTFYLLYWYCNLFLMSGLRRCVPVISFRFCGRRFWRASLPLRRYCEPRGLGSATSIAYSISSSSSFSAAYCITFRLVFRAPSPRLFLLCLPGDGSWPLTSSLPMSGTPAYPCFRRRFLAAILPSPRRLLL